MRVHDGVHIGPLPVHLEVHQQLGRGIAVAGDFLPVDVHDDHHVGRHVALGHVLRRREHPVGREADADVAVVAGAEPAAVQTPADLDDVGAEAIDLDFGHR
jgi:hypothetical protein